MDYDSRRTGDRFLDTGSTPVYSIEIQGMARVAMSDEETARKLERTRPAPAWEELIADKMRRKGMTRKEATKDILDTASKTNTDVNKEFGLQEEIT